MKPMEIFTGSQFILTTLFNGNYTTLHMKLSWFKTGFISGPGVIYNHDTNISSREHHWYFYLFLVMETKIKSWQSILMNLASPIHCKLFYWNLLMEVVLSPLLSFPTPLNTTHVWVHPQFNKLEALRLIIIFSFLTTDRH